MVRVTVHFFLIGATLMAVQLSVSALEQPAQRSLVVTVPARSDADEIREHVDEAILIEEGLRLGWHLTDPVIRRKLVRNMRFVDGVTEVEVELSFEQERRLFERALELGMHRADPVVRRRLVMRAHRAIQRGARRMPARETELEAYLEDHLERFERPVRLRFSQIFLSRQQRGLELQNDARRLEERLRDEVIAPETGYRLGDPLLLLDVQQGQPSSVSVTDLERRYGRGFGAAVGEAPMQQWSGPVTSSYGLHFVWVHERSEAARPALSEVRRQVLESYLHEQVEPRARTEHLKKLRSHYDIRVQLEDGEAAR